MATRKLYSKSALHAHLCLFVHKWAVLSVRDNTITVAIKAVIGFIIILVTIICTKFIFIFISISIPNVVSMNP
jgi:hypothetical protein